MGKDDTDKQYSSICIACMADKGSSSICQHCGYDEQGIEQHPLHLKPRTILKKQYLIGKVLGQGGFGITYLGMDLNLYKKVAIKEFLPSSLASRDVGMSTIIPFKGSAETFFSKGLQSFIQEARSVAKFSRNVHIVNVNNYFEDNNSGYMVMDYLDGEPLSDLLKRKGGKLPLDVALKILNPIFNALQDVHSMGIYHRDISPQNIIITRDGVPVLIDFGAARYIVGEQSHSLDVILKPGYSPLEQYASKGKIGPWTDIYACGAIFYQMITGKLPRPATDRVYSDDLIQPSDIDGINISPNLNDIILRALAVRIEDRFQTISEFKSELEKTPYDEYQNLLTETLKDKEVSLYNRISLDSFIYEHQLNYNRAIQIEETLREDSHIPSISWESEYKKILRKYIKEYPGGIPQELDEKLRITYVSAKRISEETADKILKSFRKEPIKVNKKIVYGAGALIIFLVLIGSMYFFNIYKEKQLMALDTSPPEGTIIGLKESYFPGDTISYTIKANDDISLKKMTFTVENTSIEKSWSLKGKSADKEHSFKTEEWEPGIYNYSLVIEDKAKKKRPYPGTFTLVQYGRINIWSNPAADIFINGESYGRTPKSMIKVPAGKVEIRLVNKTYNIDETYTENIAPDKMLSLK